MNYNEVNLNESEFRSAWIIKEENIMVQLIVGEKGKGKTKELLNLVDDTLANAEGNVVYIDKTQQHMYALNNKIRLIDASEYKLLDSHEFIGFLCGILSEDNDLEAVFLDSFLTIANVEVKDLTPVIHRLNELGTLFNVKFVASVSAKPEDIEDEIKEYVKIAL